MGRGWGGGAGEQEVGRRRGGGGEEVGSGWMRVGEKLRFGQIGQELSLERTRASRLPPDGCTRPTSTPLNAPPLTRSRHAQTQHLFAPHNTNPTCCVGRRWEGGGEEEVCGGWMRVGDDGERWWEKVGASPRMARTTPHTALLQDVGRE